MPVDSIMSVVGVGIALLVLLFLIFIMVYLLAPQWLDQHLRQWGLGRGLGMFSQRNLFWALTQLGVLMILLGVLTLGMVWFQAWPRGWLIPAIQELIMAVILFVVGYLGARAPR